MGMESTLSFCKSLHEIHIRCLAENWCSFCRFVLKSVLLLLHQVYIYVMEHE